MYNISRSFSCIDNGLYSNGDDSLYEDKDLFNVVKFEIKSSKLSSIF